LNNLSLRWHVFRCRQRSDTRTRYLLELAAAVAACPRGADPPPIVEIGTRKGGSALLMLRILDAVYPRDARRPLLLTVDPYGMRPYEGAPFSYDERHYRAMKRALAGFANHIHYMMDSDQFLALLPNLALWMDGTLRPVDRFTLVYLDGSHDPAIVWREISALLPRIIPGGFLVVDDTDWYDGELRRRLEREDLTRNATIRHNGKQSVIALGG
jgi:predicted O-methyltransferase YrrM